ncbi:MAG: tRNA (guanosine(37)-N1)-methyltransferase TrmD [Fastidiosipila sp.]|nr:tRNA (guanosine(37)-N1)-methyltransferase TrmD [Fastidiosipila sp.]HPX93533.1 tRNA (guanosine(37)-N1)-methyltransferase TrmD [Bacillota bacterium]
MPLKFSVLSLFPQQVRQALDFSMTRRALEKGLIELETVDIRDFAVNEYGQVDDAPYGGGRGMVMMCEPIYRAWQSVVSDSQDVRTIYLSPAGQVFDHRKAREYSVEEQLVFICGHYEGVDRRVLDQIGVEEVSIGNFILTGGELAATVMIDAISRFIPGVLPDEEAWRIDSFSDGLLEWPQYTRPAVWREREVPGVLRSGHQADIDRERRLMQLLETLQKKPFLLQQTPIDPQLWELLAERLAMQRDALDESTE